MDHFELARPHRRADEDPQDRNRLRWARPLTLAGAMMLAGSFWWFLGRILLGV